MAGRDGGRSVSTAEWDGRDGVQAARPGEAEHGQSEHELW